MNSQASHRLIYSAGTQVVTAKDVMAQNERIAHPAGSVGVVVQAPIDRTHAYRVKFADGFEAAIHHDQLTRLADYKRQQIGASDSPLDATLEERISDSSLPEVPSVKAALNELLVRLRLAEIGG